MKASPMPAITHLTIGVSDLDDALALWCDTFGLDLVGQRAGPDEDLARLWGLQPQRVARQASVGAADVEHGRLHLVQFTDPAPPVRAGAAPTDRCPKNIDLRCVDLLDRHRELSARGHTFRSEPAEYPYEGSTVREVQMHGPDDTNIVLVEIVDEPVPATPQGYTAMTAFVCVVGEPESEGAFHRDVLGLDHIAAHRLTGPEIETMVGLPPGAALNLDLYGAAATPFGRFEVVHYEGVEGADRYGRAAPPALGALHAAVAVDDLGQTVGRLRDAGAPTQDHGEVDLLFGQHRVVSTRTPAGLRLDLLAPPT